MKCALSVVAVTLLCLMSSVADAPTAFAQLGSTPDPKWHFDSGSIEGAKPADTNVANNANPFLRTGRGNPAVTVQ
jgi:hypothetical protein